MGGVGYDEIGSGGGGYGDVGGGDDRGDVGGGDDRGDGDVVPCW